MTTDKVHKERNWNNLEKGCFPGKGRFDLPFVEPVTSLPEVSRHIEFDYAARVRGDKKKLAVHFFEDDYKFERVWNDPDRYGKELQQFGYVIGPDFSVYDNFPMAVRIYNFYRNNWLAKYWQSCYNILVVPTVMWGWEDTWEWCFDGLPRHSIVAVSNVGCATTQADKEYFMGGYLEMLRRLEPSQVLFFSRNFAEVPGNVKYIRWEIHKGDQLYGERKK